MGLVWAYKAYSILGSTAIRGPSIYPFKFSAGKRPIATPEMAVSEQNDRLSAFVLTGIYRFEGSDAMFIDPVRILNRSYTRFKVSPSAYYSRFFDSIADHSTETHNNCSSNSKKRKRNKKKEKSQNLNPREQIADQRHQEARSMLLKAHEALIKSSELLEIVKNLRNDGCDKEKCETNVISQDSELDFVEVGNVWQAPLYEITLNFHQDEMMVKNAGLPLFQFYEQRVVPVFNSLVANEGSSDVEAEFLNHRYIVPKKSCFYMSDLGKIHNLIPAESDRGFNLIVIDPPWENSSAHQKLKYRTLPNRYFLSLPIKQFTHTAGSLVALWVTNREKLRSFVENELFPKWGVKYAATFYWLKVKADGLLISELDLFHHRPYECVLLGYCHRDDMKSEHLLRLNHVPANQVFVSVPGDYSRKPPIGELLLEYVPGFRPARSIELFSREMIADWTSWDEALALRSTSMYLTYSQPFVLVVGSALKQLPVGFRVQLGLGQNSYASETTCQNRHTSQAKLVPI
ncbi:Methyltransferase-like protein 2 [Abeliophyllum distichum]|uniref:Methyltransferase-like protein 2 n=1 Tax=Abeliophyllum distichum TaxID=126358 RepID=A0ABD1SC76_9LAMI